MCPFGFLTKALLEQQLDATTLFKVLALLYTYWTGIDIIGVAECTLHKTEKGV